MPVERIENLPAGTRLFLDANIFVYAFLGHSNECQGLLGRCATEQVLGITTLDMAKASLRESASETYEVSGAKSLN